MDGAGRGDRSRAAENGSQNHVSLSAAYVQPRWRVGASYNTIDGSAR